jgi:hypothetical protein
MRYNFAHRSSCLICLIFFFNITLDTQSASVERFFFIFQDKSVSYNQLCYLARICRFFMTTGH